MATVRVVFFEWIEDVKDEWVLTNNPRHCNESELILTEIREMEITRTKAGKFDAETQDLFECFIDASLQGRRPQMFVSKEN